MNVEKLQKINMLASELRKHNMGMSSFEAVHEAEQIYDVPTEQGNALPIRAEKEHFSPANFEEGSFKTAMGKSQYPSLEQKQFEFLMQRHNRKYEEQFELMRSAINKLAEELEALKMSVGKIKAQQPKEVQVPLSQPALSPKPAKQEPHPRQGNFCSDDVDIQKMFYFGSKR